MPSGWLAAVRRCGSFALASTVLSVLSVTYADPDLWGHVRFGRDIVAARAARLADSYSFTSDVPWVNHEWASEVLMYAAYATAGAAGLVLLKIAVLLTMIAGVALALRDARLPRFARDALLGVLVIATIPQTILVRPQLLSLALFAWLLTALLRPLEPRWMFVPVPIMLAWANVHGGWLVGAATLGIWAAATMVEKRGSRGAWRVAAIAATALLATLVNPYGAWLWVFLYGTVGIARPDIADWQPILRTAPVFVALWVAGTALLMAACTVAIKRGRLDLPLALVSIALCVGTYRVGRLQAFFAISVVILAGRQLGRSVHAANVHSQPERATRPVGWRAACALTLFLAVLALTTRATAANAKCIRIASSEFPEPEAAGFVADHHLRGRMLTWFGWGEYAIWHFADRGVLVSMDGRRETVYSDRTVNAHLRFYFDAADRERVLEVLDPDYIWLPVRLDAVEWLKAHGWRAVFTGPRSAVLTRRGPVIDAPSARVAQTQGCFPGP